MICGINAQILFMKIFSCLFLSLFFAICKPCFAQQNTSNAFVKVSGDLTKPLNLYAADLAKMKRSAVTMKDHDGSTRPYAGVAIRDILEQAGATTGKELRGKNLAKFLVVKCADGYEVVFSLAELDSSFNDRLVILADESAGKPLPADKGPFRVIVPDEKRPARSAFKVTELIVRTAKEQ